MAKIERFRSPLASATTDSSLAAAIPHGEFLEYYPVAVDPLRADMLHPLFKPADDGHVTVPDRPGIGFELNMELLDRYRVG